MRNCRSAILIAAALVSGCSGAQILVRGMTTARRVCPNGVVFFPSAGEVPGKYREVALLSIEGVLGREEARRAGAMYRQHAGELGANGIILTSAISRDAGAKVIGPAIGDPSQRRGMAVAVYIPSDSNRVGEACPSAEASGAAVASATVSAARDMPFVTSAISSSRGRRPSVRRVPAAVRPFDLSGRQAQAVKLQEDGDSDQSAQFILNQDVRSALTNLERLKIVTGAEEVRPGLVRLSLGQMAPLAQMEYHIGFLHGSYQAALPYGADAVVELWSKGSKMGEYTRDGLLFNEAP
ncbi:MAG: hypothetical protein ACREL3_03515 [Gemmatimonadales bacterium]